MPKTENIDDLIARLGDDLETVTPLPYPLQRAGIWLFSGLFSIILIGAFVGFRMDLPDKIQQPAFFVEIILILLLAASGAYASAWLSLPDGAENKKTIYLPYGLVLLGIIGFSFELFRHGFHLEELHWHHCIIDGMVMGTIPVLMMIWMMRAGAPTRPVLGALTNMVAAGAIGYLGLRLTCGSDDMAHVCIYHVMPFVILGLVIGLLARRLYRW